MNETVKGKERNPGGGGVGLFSAHIGRSLFNTLLSFIIVVIIICFAFGNLLEEERNREREMNYWGEKITRNKGREFNHLVSKRPKYGPFGWTWSLRGHLVTFLN